MCFIYSEGTRVFLQRALTPTAQVNTLRRICKQKGSCFGSWSAIFLQSSHWPLSSCLVLQIFVLVGGPVTTLSMLEAKKCLYRFTFSAPALVAFLRWSVVRLAPSAEPNLTVKTVYLCAFLLYLKFCLIFIVLGFFPTVVTHDCDMFFFLMCLIFWRNCH